MYKPLRVVIFLTLSIVATLTSASAYAFNPSVNIAPKPDWLSNYKPYDQKPNLRTIESGYYYALIPRCASAGKVFDARKSIPAIIHMAISTKFTIRSKYHMF